MEVNSPIKVDSLMFSMEILSLTARVEDCKRGANKERIQEVKAALENAVSAVIPFTAEAADVYGRIKGSLNIPSADAIHLACAATAGTDLFLTNNQALVGKVIPGIQFIAGLDSNII